MDILVGVVLPLALAFIMFSLGVGLTAGDFLRVLQRPAAFVVGAVHQVVLLPVAAFAVITAFGIDGELAVGFMILAACPGGVTSNIIARFARGDVALSVSLTAVVSLASAVTVPLVLAFAMSHFMAGQAPEIDITRTALTMFALTVVPILLGVALRAVFPRAMARADRPLGIVAAVLFTIIVLAALAANWGIFAQNVQVLGPALIVLLALLTVAGYAVPRLIGRSRLEAKTVSIETGVQNATLGITVATLIVGAGAGFTAYSIPSAVYGILMYLIIIPAVFVFRRME